MPKRVGRNGLQSERSRLDSDIAGCRCPFSPMKGIKADISERGQAAVSRTSIGEGIVQGEKNESDG